MARKYYDYEARLAIKNRGDEKGVTLNGQKATIVGLRSPFAQVTIDGVNRVEYAWETAERIVNRDGAFKS